MERVQFQHQNNLYNKEMDKEAKKGRKMKIKLQRSSKINPGHIVLTCHQNDHAYILDLVQHLNEHLIKIKVKNHRDQTMQLVIDDIFYVEVVNTKVFVYTNKDVYEYKGKFKDLYHYLKRFSFVQVNRNTFVNKKQIHSTKVLPQCHRAIILKNKETIIANRKYKDNLNF